MNVGRRLIPAERDSRRASWGAAKTRKPIAPAPVAKALEETSTRMANRPPVSAPRVKPTMSGLPSGLRETL